MGTSRSGLPRYVRARTNGPGGATVYCWNPSQPHPGSMYKGLGANLAQAERDAQKLNEDLDRWRQRWRPQAVRELLGIAKNGFLAETKRRTW